MAAAISMPLFSEEPRLSLGAIAAWLETHCPELPPIDDNPDDAESAAGREGVFVVKMGDHMIAIAKMPSPFPWADLEGPCATSVLWKNAEAELRDHKAHVIVSVMSDLAPIPRAALLTQLSAAVMATTANCLGIYWGSAALIVPRDIFIEFTLKILPAGAPLHIWIDFRVGPDFNDTSTGFTAGMSALGHMEIEAIKTPESPHDLLERLTGLADYLLANGPVIKDGNTVGQDENERIQVKYAKSQFGHEGTVMRLDYTKTKTKKPFYKFW